MSTKRTALTVLIAAVSVVAAVSTSQAAAGAPTRTTTGRGIETIIATSANLAPSSVTVHASGVYGGTGTFRLPVTGKATTLRFVFGNGTLAVAASASWTVTGNYNCPLNVTTTRTYTIIPRLSTGVFAMAAGASDYTALTTEEMPRLADGACDLASGVKPVGGAIYVSITIQGTLTLHHRGY